MPTKIEVANVDDIIRRYEAGASVNQLAGELHVSRNVIDRWLRERGIHRRGQSEAEFAKWRAMKNSPGVIERQLARAWQARRGARDPLARKIARAATMQRRLLRIGRWENEIATYCEAQGLRFRQQRAVQSYNLDLAHDALRIAVEVQSANHTCRASSIRRDRVEDVLDRGWSVLVVWIPQHAVADVARIGEKLLAFAERARREPSIRGQYGVIGRHGQPMTPRGYDLPRRPRVEGF